MKLCSQCTIGYHDSHTSCPTHGGLLSEIRDLKPGMVIRGTYRIVRKLGQGGMGTVYLAEHTLMGEPRALKFLSLDLSQDSSFASRFLREVRTLRQVRNDNVVDCGDLEQAEDDSLYFPMEFVDGPDLRDFLDNTRAPLDVPLALEIARGIAAGLGAAHAKGLVHRDIKPENILLARDDEGKLVPKIADFGIVATKESNSNRTRTGMTLLTMAYAAPEQWRGMTAAELDGRTDLYAFGGILFEMLAGQTVFHAENYEGWGEKHRTAVPPAPRSLRPELANWRGLDNLVLGLLAKDREQRPKDVAAVLRLLDAVVYAPPKPDKATVLEISSTGRSKAKQLHALFLILGLAIYGISFLLTVIPEGTTDPSIKGLACALFTLQMTGAFISHPGTYVSGDSFFSGTTLKAFSMIFAGWINLFFLTSLPLKIWRRTRKLAAILTGLVVVFQVFCWICFYPHMPREGYFVWVTGMLIASFAGPIGRRIQRLS